MKRTPKKAAPYRAHYISGTHWDREWYRPFQEYRFLLVNLMDELLRILETNRDFRYFQLDGQTCMLDDYLEIRPENRERLAGLIRSGRILVGPWYTMPDLFCPDDESLVRNLLLGRRIAREWDTQPMPVGFICDMFGHPSQMPQIFAGFGIRDIVLGRGTNEHTTPMFFAWQAPDGTRAFTFKLQDKDGYGAFALPRAYFERPESAPHLPRGREFAAALEAAGTDPRKVDAAKEKYMREALAGYIGNETARCNGRAIAVMDAMDHILPAPDVGRYLRLIREGCPAVAPAHSTLPKFFADARRSVTRLPTRRGELREPSRDRTGYLWLIPNCVSSRVRLKQANDQAAALLERWAEPLVALAAAEGAAIPARFLRVAWQQIVTNHAHDSICGCSIDQVHRDMMYRFDQARILGEQLKTQALARLTANARELGREKDEFTLVVCNPLTHALDESVVFDIDLPPDFPTQFQEGFGTQIVKSFLLETADGTPVPYQRLGIVPRMNERSRLAKFMLSSEGEFLRYTVAARLRLPACGFTTLRLKPSPRPVRALGTLRTGPLSAENEHLAMAVESNGTIRLTDKATGQIYHDLLTFEDRSEIGDGWFHGHSVNDEEILSTASPAQASVVHDGPEQVTFRATIALSVPARYDWRGERPADERVPLQISSLVSLRRGARVLDVETTVENTAGDHRLRLLLPADVPAAKRYVAHTAYDLVTRAIALDPKTADWQEMEIAEKPFQSLQAVGAGRRGLAFLSAGGLHEGGVRDDRRRTMQVTLLRSFRRTVATSGERDGLEAGRIVCRYALMPYRGTLPAAAALREVARLQAGLATRQSGPRPSGHAPLPARGATGGSFLEQRRGTLVLTALKPAEDGKGLIVRLWNPTARTQKEQLVFRRHPRQVQSVTLAETPAPRNTARARGAAVAVSARPREIVSVRVVLD